MSSSVHTFALLVSWSQCRCTNLVLSCIPGSVSRTFVHTCIWLPVIRRKAFTGNDIARPVHQHRFHDRDVKPNAVKAVTALHPKMTAHGPVVSRPTKAKQTTKQPDKRRKHMRKADEHMFNTTRQTDSTFVHTCMWLPLVRRRASTGSDISHSAHHSKIHDRDIKPNAVKAVTALHLKMTAYAQMTSRLDKPKQANQTARQAQ